MKDNFLMNIQSRDIPQADDLDEVIMVVEAVAKGKRTTKTIARALGVTERQGQYYRRATEILELIICKGVESHITLTGKKLLDSKPKEQQKILIDKIQNIPIFQLTISTLKKNEACTEYELIEEIKKSTNMTKSMLRRRLRTIISWLQYVHLIKRSDDEISLENNPESTDNIVSSQDNSITKTIELTKSSSIVIAKSVWKDQDRLDIRTYIKTENYTGPTKKGINLPIEKMDEIISVLKEIKEYI